MIRIRTALLLAVTGGLVGCADDDGATLPTVIDRIVLTPEAVSITTLSTDLAFEAEARTAADLPVTGVDFDWTSSDPSVATISADGTATSVGYGETTITVEVDGVQAHAILSVRDCDASLALAPGEWQAVAVPAPGDCGVILPAGVGGERYRVAVVSVDTTPTAGGPVAFDVRPLGVVTDDDPDPAPGVTTRTPYVSAPGLSAAAARTLGDAARVSAHTARVHHEMRREEALLLRDLSPDALLSGTAPAGAPARQSTPPPPSIQLDPNTSSCEASEPVEAELVYHDEQFAFYQDAEQRAGAKAVTRTQVQRMADYYRDHGQEVIERYFEGVSDIDGNGRVIVFITPEVVFPTAAYVWSGDFFSRGSGGCAASNRAEIIYFGADIILAQDNAAGSDWQSLVTLVHEMKHVSSLYRRVVRTSSGGEWPYHPAWIEEGTAEIAGNMAARAAWASIGGPQVHERVTPTEIQDHGVDENGDPYPEFFGIAIQFFRTQGYLSSQPNSLVLTPSGAGSDHSIYGSGWTFFRWIGDSYGDAGAAPMADADLFLRLNSSESPPGLAGLEAETGLAFPQLMERYAAAVMLHSTPSVPEGLDYTSYDFPEVIEMFCFAADEPCEGATRGGPPGAWPWPVTTDSEGDMTWTLQQATVFEGSMGPAGLRIHELVSNGTGLGAEVRITAPPRTRVVVARIE